MSRLYHYFHHYSSMILFVAAVMVGVQVPNFVDQYVKRVDAHFIEAKANFHVYKGVANRLHDGSIEELADRYRASSDPSVQAGAEAIEQSLARVHALDDERMALQGNLWQQLIAMAKTRNWRLLKDTYRSYSAGVPLNLEAGICGLLAGVLACVFFELVLSFLGMGFGRVMAKGGH